MKIFGHPVHPMLVVLPLGLFIGAIVIDTLYLLTGNNNLPTISYYDISLGILGGLLAAVFGFIDWLGVESNTRAKQIGGWHGVGNVVVVTMFALSWWTRRADVDYVPSQLALFFSYAGILLVTVTAWLGGEMVFRLKVGVDQSANVNVNSPSSLPNKSAGTTANKNSAGSKNRQTSHR